MFATLKVRTKLVGEFLVLVLIGSAVAVVGIFNMGRINAMASDMYQRELMGRSYIEEANIDLICVGRARGNNLLPTPQQERDTNMRNIRKYTAAIQDKLDKARQLFVTDEAKRMFAEYTTVAASYDTELTRALALADKEGLASRSEALTLALADTRKHANVLDDLLSNHRSRNRRGPG